MHKRLRRYAAMAILACSLASAALPRSGSAGGRQKVSVYFPNWNVYDSAYGQVKDLPWDAVDCVYHAFWKIAPSGGGYPIVSTDPYADTDPSNPKAHFPQYAKMSQKYPKVDAVWAGDDDVLVGALKAYEKSKRTDVKAMLGGGGSKIMVKKILDGDPLVKATVTYSPAMIKVGIEKAIAHHRAVKAGTPEDGKKETLIPSEIVVKDTAAKYYFPESVY